MDRSQVLLHNSVESIEAPVGDSWPAAKNRGHAIAKTEESSDEKSKSRPRQNAFSTFVVQKNEDAAKRHVAKNNFINIVQESPA